MPANTTELEERLRSSAPYSSKIIKAGALIGDTKTLLSHWDVDSSVDENLNRVRRDNVFGKASRSRVEDILAIFRQRYLTERSVTNALVTLVRAKFSTAALERLLYFHSARADELLHDAVTEILVPMQARGLVDINVQNFPAKSGLLSSPEEQQADLLRRLKFERIVPREVGDLFHQLRIAGNRATHGHTGDHAEALSTLKIARELGIWFHRTFSDKKFSAGAFVPPAASCAFTENVWLPLRTSSANSLCTHTPGRH
jgi:Putative inner membrane protein (DUF1819)